MKSSTDLRKEINNINKKLNDLCKIAKNPYRLKMARRVEILAELERLVGKKKQKTVVLNFLESKTTKK